MRAPDSTYLHKGSLQYRSRIKWERHLTGKPKTKPKTSKRTRDREAERNWENIPECKRFVSQYRDSVKSVCFLEARKLHISDLPLFYKPWWETIWQFPPKHKIYTPFNTALSLLGTYPIDVNAYTYENNIYKDIYPAQFNTWWKLNLKPKNII